MKRKSTTNTLPFNKNRAEFWFNITFHRAEAEDYDDLFSDQEIYEMERNALIDIQNLFGSKVTSKGSVPYLGGTSYTQSIDCVIYPKSLEEVAKIAKIIERNADDIGDDWHIKTSVEYFTANNFRLYPQGLRGKEYYGFDFYNDEGYQYLTRKGKTAMRRSASEIISDLEARVARLEKQAHWNKMTSVQLVKMIERNGVKLPDFDPNISRKEAIKITTKVGMLLGNLMARVLMTEGQIRITNIIVAKLRRLIVIGSYNNKFICMDGQFQQAFLQGFERSDYFDEILSDLHEQAANYDVPASEYPRPRKLSKRIKFSVSGNELVINLRH